MPTRKRESWFVLGFLLLAVIIGLSISLLSPTAHIKYAEEPLHFQEEDFKVQSAEAAIEVGSETLADVESEFGKGRFLGMSTVYEPPSRDFRLRFPKNQDTVWIFDTVHPGYFTSRGISVGDPIDKVVKAYGENYSKVTLDGDRERYDLVYGSSSEGTVTFHCQNGVVSRIVVSRHPATK